MCSELPALLTVNTLVRVQFTINSYYMITNFHEIYNWLCRVPREQNIMSYSLEMLASVFMKLYDTLLNYILSLIAKVICYLASVPAQWHPIKFVSIWRYDMMLDMPKVRTTIDCDTVSSVIDAVYLGTRLPSHRCNFINHRLSSSKFSHHHIYFAINWVNSNNTVQV